MKQILRKFYLLTLTLFLIGSVNSYGQGKEDFSNLPTASSTSYLARTWVGTDGLEWSAVGARTDQTINGKAICWGSSGDRNLVTPLYSGGMGTLSFNYVRAFTGTSARSLEVYVNNTLISTITVSNTSDEVMTFTKDLNLTGDVFLEIRSTGAAQVKVDDVMWTGYDPTAGSLSNFALSDNTVESGQTITFTWDAVNVNYIKFQVYGGEEEGWFDLEELSSVDATLGTLDFIVPLDADGGEYKMRIMARDNSAIISNEVTFNLADVSFAGMEDNPTYPAANETGVPTDLFFVFDTDQGKNMSVFRIFLYFKEDVQAGTGNISVFNVTDGTPAYSFDVAASSNIEYWGDVVVLNINENLLAGKEYRVTIPSGALTDKASTPNVFTGTEWSFTTGSRGGFRTIAEIQTPIDPGASDASPYVNSYLMTSGVVTYKRSTGFFMQDGTSAWSGIYVYDPNTTSMVNVGDNLTLAGKVEEFNQLTEITSVISYQVFGPQPLPEPVVITMPFDNTNSEQWESMLVKVENVTHTTMGSGGEFNVVDGSSNTGIIDDYLYTYAPAVDEAFDYIAGIMNNYQSAYKLAPRSADDIATKTNSIGAAEQLNLMVYPNPVVDQLRIRSDENLVLVEVVNMAGQVVATSNRQSAAAGEVIIPMGQCKQGVYLVKVTNGNGSVVVKKIVKK